MFQPMETNPFQDMMDLSQVVAILSGAANSMSASGNTEVATKIGQSVSNLMDDFEHARTLKQEQDSKPPEAEGE